MTSDEFDRIELPALEQLQSLGWVHVGGADLAPGVSEERNSFSEVVLEQQLTESIQRINPWVNKKNLDKVVRGLTRTQYAGLVEANKAIWENINQCVSVKQDLGKGNKNQTVHIIDFENPDNNSFICVNQFRVSGVDRPITPDIVLFVNGLPLSVIECKSPHITDPMAQGINQLLRYANRRNVSDEEGAEKLFHYNLMMVSTCGTRARVGTITSRAEHFLEWKDPYPLTVEEVGAEAGSQEVLIAGLFSRANFLDILQNFTVFETVDGVTLKKMARYQQFRAVHRTIERLKSGKERQEKSGVVWHTQGSGKSLTMAFLSIKMRRDPELRSYKLVFLTDRTQLDDQLTGVFSRTLGETVRHADSIKSLKRLLKQDSSDIVTAMVQKFQDDEAEFPELNPSREVIVLADEAHRTQYGILGAAMNTALPNAPRIAFTGTPLMKEQKTARTFGDYIDTYTIEQAVEDGATVQILYEGRKPELWVTRGRLDRKFEQSFADYTEDEKANIKRRYSTERMILEAPDRICKVSEDIVAHYQQHIQPDGFKAMIVTSSRNAAVLYKEQLDQLLDASQSAVVISADQNDEPRLRQYTDGARHKRQIEDFKKPLGKGEDQSELSFLIVNDMLLTGFDAPIAQVMYLDRKLTDHTLLQAIARVNRIRENKARGFVIDYYGLSDYLIEALDMFSASEVQGALIELKDEIPRLRNAHTRVLGHFKDMDLDDAFACVLSLKDEIKRQDFQADFRSFCRQLNIVLPDPEATPFLNDLKRLGRISVEARNHYRDEQLNIAGAGEKVRKLIEEHVRVMGIDPTIPPVELLAENYKEHLSQHKSARARASEIEQAIRHYIRVNIDEDPEYYKKLSERLEDIIRKHEGRWEEQAQLMMNLEDDARNEREQQANTLGLSYAELPFYHSLTAELEKRESIDESKKGKIKEVVQLIARMLEKETKIVDFWRKPDEPKRIKLKIRRIVIANFDEALAKPVTESFMELAEQHYK